MLKYHISAFIQFISVFPKKYVFRASRRYLLRDSIMSAAMDAFLFSRRSVRSASFIVILIACICLTTESKHKSFSSKTAYELIHPPPENIVEDDWNSVQVGTFSCLAAHASAIFRHGSRFPGLEDKVVISEIHDRIKETLPDKFKKLKDWSNAFPHNNEKSIMEIGEDEHFRLGQRMAKRLKTLFVDEDMENFRFQVSSIKRTQESATSFYEGFIENLLGDADEKIDSELSDETLRFHERCQKYVHSVDNNKTALKEYHDFKEGKEMGIVLNKVNNLLNIAEGVLSKGNLRTIFLICGYETAMFGDSPWCELFDEEDVNVLEYLQDLKHYYKNGPGHAITGTQSCPLVTDMFTTMDDAIETLETEDDEEELNGYVLGNFNFGHAETIGPLYAALGLYNDSVPLRAGNFEQQTDRKFRSSQILPFSANLMMILYECDQNDEMLTESEAADETRETTQYMLSLYVNEKPVKIPGCDDYVCLYKDVRKRYEDLIECNFSELCQVTHPKDEL